MATHTRPLDPPGRVERDARLADALVEGERLVQRPAVLDGVEAAGGHGAAGVPSSLKEGLVGPIARQARALPQTMPVPRGPKGHLWQPAMEKWAPGSGMVTSSTPRPCTIGRVPWRPPGRCAEDDDIAETVAA